MTSWLLKKLRHLRRDERGNIFVLFGASAIPLLLVMGGAVDLARYTRYKADLANAVDAAALALARQGADFTEAQATTFVTNYVTSFPIGDNEFNVESFAVDKLDNGFLVTATGSMNAMFLPLGKLANMGSSINAMDVNVVAEVVNSSNRVEVAFVFDNTGSMTDYAGSNACGVGTDKMAGLKCAATTLVQKLTDDMNGGATPALKMAVVPFEGAVNVGVSQTMPQTPPSWIDWADQKNAKFTGMNLNAKDFGGSIGTKNVGHKWLYNKLGIAWAGCVEMRAEPYDILDAAPNAAVPDTLFVPMFWPDEPDTSTDYWNSYLNDGVWSSNAATQKSLTKYDKTSPSLVSWLSGKKDVTFPYDYGPNRGCPRPITPLTTTKATIDTAIAAMTPHAATGTFVPTGLVWGWHVLSKGEPFTEGVGPSDADYDETIKAVVLMSDGDNSPTVRINNNHNQSTYSGYNYTTTPIPPATNKYRLQATDLTTPPTNSQAVANLNAKTAALCANVKSNGTTATDDDIRLYTITFGTLSTTSTDLMRNCASTDEEGTKLYFHAPNSQQLGDIFDAIGEDLNKIHLSM